MTPSPQARTALSREDPQAAPSSRRPGRALSAVLLLAGPAQFLLGETVAAASWRSPGYSYYRDFISDLGVKGPTVYQGREVHSPLYWLMNSSFVLLGVAVGMGIWILAVALPASAYRRWLRVVGVLFGVGGVLVGLYPENSIELAHAGGAFLNIGGGNVLLILVGARGHRFGLPRRLSRLVLGLGVIGLVAMVVLVAVPALFNGAVERAAAYPYMFTLILLATLALTDRRATEPAGGLT